MAWLQCIRSILQLFQYCVKSLVTYTYTKLLPQIFARNKTALIHSLTLLHTYLVTFKVCLGLYTEYTVKSLYIIHTAVSL